VSSKHALEGWSDVLRLEVEQFGIDVLVNNAGIAVGSAIEDVSMEDALYQFEVNLFGIGRTVKATLPHMRAQGSGTIINISSVLGKAYNPLYGWYVSSKHALEGWSDVLRLEVEQFGIDVLVNNAGIAVGSAIEDVSMEDALYQFEVNLFGIGRTVKATLPHMRAQGSGTIINISSVLGKAYNPLYGWYVSSKHALEGWSDVLRLEVEQFGIDVLVNNAGIAVGSAIEDVSMEDALYQFEVNLFGIGRTVKATLPHMRAQGSGTIINISSVLGKAYNPLYGWYVSSKHALEGWSDVLRLEVEQFGIDVLVNNAGIAVGSAIEDVSMEDALYQFEVNLFGIGRTVKATLPHMRAQGSGTIINISSVLGKAYNPLYGWYVSSKHALEG
jgi:short-subunit dehydrogenase